MKPLKTIEIPAILELLREYLHLVIKRPTLYHYMRKHSFPKPYKLGRPKRWSEEKVRKWIANQIKNSS